MRRGVVLPFELCPADLLSEPHHETRWRNAFGADRPLRVEIGVGNSDFLIQVARRDPGYNYVGFEYSPKRVVKFLNRVACNEIENIRLVRSDAVPLLEGLFAPQSVDRFYINFPDPWPKRRHAKHRIVQAPTARLMARILAGGAGLSLRTDSADYAEQMLRVLEKIEDFENLAGAGTYSSAPRDAIPTRYELQYRREGRPIYFLEYRKRRAAERCVTA